MKFTRRIDNIIETNKPEPELIRQKILECLDLTTLSSIDNNESVLSLVEKSNNLNPIKLAGICVFPKYIEIVNRHKKSPDVSTISVVGGFPFSQIPIELKLNEISYCIERGCDEFDMVIDRGEVLDKNYKYVSRETYKAKELIENKTLKTILEIGELKTLDLIKQTSLLVLESGSDFIKTSTGKISQGADLYSFGIMLESLKEHYNKYGELKGIKAAGGIRSFEDAYKYAVLFIDYFGLDNLNKNHFRIGGSSLLESLLPENQL